MGIFQIDTVVFHGENGSWLYIFSVLGISAVWALAATSLTSFFYNIFNRKISILIQKLGFKTLVSEAIIVIFSIIFAYNINYGLQEIENESIKMINNKKIIPSTGFKGLYAAWNYLLFYENIRIANADLTNSNTKIINQLKKNYEACLRLKPNLKIVNMQMPLSLSFRTQTSELMIFNTEAFKNYLKNPYIKKNSNFEFQMVSILTSHNNPERESILPLGIETLRKILKEPDATVDKKQVLKKIITLNSESIRKSLWQDRLIPIDEHFAELLFWFSEWKKSVTLQSYEPLMIKSKIEELLLLSAEKAEKNSQGNKYVLASIENIRRKIFLVNYALKSDSLKN